MAGRKRNWGYTQSYRDRLEKQPNKYDPKPKELDWDSLAKQMDDIAKGKSKKSVSSTPKK